MQFMLKKLPQQLLKRGAAPLTPPGQVLRRSLVTPGASSPLKHCTGECRQRAHCTYSCVH